MRQRHKREGVVDAAALPHLSPAPIPVRQGAKVPPLPPRLAANAQPDEELLQAQGGAIVHDSPVVGGREGEVTHGQR